MNIQNESSSGAARSNPLRSTGADESAAASPASPAETGAADQGSNVGDRVDISESARQAQSDGGVDPADAAIVERGRAALEGSSLSGERLAELKQRAADGYYATPDATQQIAEAISSEAAGGA